jgi:hypothetical protein
MQPHTPAALGFTTGLEAQCGVAAHVQQGAQTPASAAAAYSTPLTKAPVRTQPSTQPPRGPTHLRGPAARADSALRRHKTNTQARADRFVARCVESVHQRTTRTRAVPTRQQPHDVASARCPATDLLAAVHAGLRILHWNQFVDAQLAV